MICVTAWRDRVPRLSSNTTSLPSLIDAEQVKWAALRWRLPAYQLEVRNQHGRGYVTRVSSRSRLGVRLVFRHQ